MTVAVIVHVEADRPYVDSLHLKLEARLVACAVQPKSPIMAFDAKHPLILVWSRHAAAQRAAGGYAAMSRAHGGQTIICVTDDTALPGVLERLPASVVNGSPRSSLFPGGLAAALSEAHRRQLHAAAAALRAPELAAQASRRAFSEGVARGLAGSVAVFGVSGAAALGVDQMSALSGPDLIAEAPQMGATSTFEDAANPAAEDEGIMFAEVDSVAWEIGPAADVPLAAPAPAAETASDVPLEIWTPGQVDQLDAVEALPALDLDRLGQVGILALRTDPVTGGVVTIADFASDEAPAPGPAI